MKSESASGEGGEKTREVSDKEADGGERCVKQQFQRSMNDCSLAKPLSFVFYRLHRASAHSARVLLLVDSNRKCAFRFRGEAIVSRRLVSILRSFRTETCK